MRWNSLVCSLNLLRRFYICLWWCFIVGCIYCWWFTFNNDSWSIGYYTFDMWLLNWSGYLSLSLSLDFDAWFILDIYMLTWYMVMVLDWESFQLLLSFFFSSFYTLELDLTFMIPWLGFFYVLIFHMKIFYYLHCTVGVRTWLGNHVVRG